MKKDIHILAINIGSTSQKMAYYVNEILIKEKTSSYTAEQIAALDSYLDQKDMREASMVEFLEELGVKKQDLDVIVSRGVAGVKQESGGYLVNQNMVDKALAYDHPHPYVLGPQIVYEWMQELGIPGYTYDSEGVDEFVDVARLSGLKEIPIRAGSHTLNQKAAARKTAKRLGGKYEDYNFVVAHLGGGISVAAHDHGKLIDSSLDAYSPERMGGVAYMSLAEFTHLCYSGKYTESELYKLHYGRGGLVSYLGTNDLREVERRIAEGDTYAELIFNGMAYQIAKNIAAMAAALNGKVDRIILTGGMAHSDRLSEALAKHTGWIAPIERLPGSYEMESLAHGALRIMRGEEEAHDFNM